MVICFLLNIEGYEYFIIKGMKKLLHEDKPDHLFIEVHPYLLSKNGLNLEILFKKLFDASFYPTFVVKEHNWFKEESFVYDGKDFLQLLTEKKVLYPPSMRGFGLFMEKRQ